MTLLAIDAMLWRSYATSTSDALWGARKNQYYIELPPSDYENFFVGYSGTSDAQGNSAYEVRLEPYEGSQPAEPYLVKIKKLRASVHRAGTWNINGQHDSSVYTLWQKGRGPTDPYTSLPSKEKNKNFLVILRDENAKFHGRWIRYSDYLALPEKVRNILDSQKAGWSLL